MRAAATPSRDTCRELASVPVARPEASIWCGMFPSLAVADQHLKQRGIDIRAPADYGTIADFKFTEFLFVDFREIGGKPDVHGNTDIGIHTIGAGSGAAQTDLLLDRKNTVDIGLYRTADA